MPEIDAEMNHNAVSVYSDGGLDDFPVLKAFQQYIDAEQAKARKRLLTMGIFFGVLMFVVIAVFVVLLQSASQRNQQLNDRLLEFVMKGGGQSAPVVVQPPVQQDNSALLSLTAKMETLQQKLQQSEKKADEAERAREKAEQAAADAVKPKGPTKQDLEIARLKALLSAEKEQRAAEAEKRRQEELELYRRKHYPELYEQPKPLKEKLQQMKSQRVVRPVEIPEEPEEPEEVEEDDVLDDNDAIDYFKEETTPAGEKHYSIPVEVKGSSSKSKWRIP